MRAREHKKDGFDAVASFYDALAYLVFGNLLKRAQCTFLDRVPDQGHILIIGGGTGWILEELLAQKPDVSVTYIEASDKMLSISKKRRVKATNVKFIHGTEIDLPLDEYDCIITNFFLDVFSEEQLGRVMIQLRDSLSQNGLWICTDFRKTAKRSHRFLLWAMHQFFRIFSGLEARRLIDFRPYFGRLNLTPIGEKEYRKGLVFSTLYGIKK